MRRAFSVMGVVAIVLALAPSARATSGTWTITSDTTLSQDHFGSIVIAADDVVLDCAGFSVIGNGTGEANGISVEEYSGVTVRNCHVQQASYGIAMLNASSGLLENNEVNGNFFSGFDVAGSTDIVVRQNLMYGNGWSGIDVEYGSSNVEISGNTGLAPGGGFYSYESTELHFDNNTSYAGFALDEGTTHSTYSNNRVLNGDRAGFVVVGSDDNRFVGNVVSGNAGAGFELTQSSRNFIGSNDILGNGEDGVLLQSDSDSNVIKNNDIRWNNYTGIPIIDRSNRNLLTGNFTSHNGDAGVRIETSHNTVLSSRADGNAGFGFWVLGSYNKLALNSGCGNGDLDAKQESGASGNVWKANLFCTSDI